jgi:hypothetical protein
MYTEIIPNVPFAMMIAWSEATIHSRIAGTLHTMLLVVTDGVTEPKIPDVRLYKVMPGIPGYDQVELELWNHLSLSEVGIYREGDKYYYETQSVNW